MPTLKTSKPRYYAPKPVDPNVDRDGVPVASGDRLVLAEPFSTLEAGFPVLLVRRYQEAWIVREASWYESRDVDKNDTGLHCIAAKRLMRPRIQPRSKK